MLEAKKFQNMAVLRVASSPGVPWMECLFRKAEAQLEQLSDLSPNREIKCKRSQDKRYECNISNQIKFNQEQMLQHKFPKCPYSWL